MVRGPLHNRGADGRCEKCGEPFPCRTGLAIYEAVKRELKHPTPPPPPAPAMPPPIAQPSVLYSPRWEDLPDREYRCPRCLPWWVSHGSEPDPEGCGIPTSSMDERERGIFETCGCQERPAKGSTIAINMAREAARQAELYDRPGQRLEEQL